MERFKFYFQNSCNDTAVTTFTVDANNGKQRFTVTGYTVSDYFDVGDEMEFNYDGNFHLYTIIDITGNAITMSFDENPDIDNTNTYLQFSPKIECFPDEFYKGKFEYKLQDREMFYRLSFKGEVTFTGDDYQYLLANIIEETCCRVNLKIYKLCDGEYTLYYRSVIKGNLGKWDLSQCFFKTELPPVDKYDCVLANYGIRKNIYETEEILVLYNRDDDSATVGGGVQSFSPYFEYYVRAVAPGSAGDTYDVGDGGALFIQINGVAGFASDPITGNAWTLYVRSAVYYMYDGDFNFIPPTLSGLTLTETNYYDGKVVAKYTAQTDVADAPTDVFYNGSSEPCEYVGVYTFAIYDPVNTHCLYVSSITGLGATSYSSRDFDNTLEFLSGICNTLSGVTSDFFEINPVEDTPGYSTGINYVTGESNYVRNLKISNVVDVIGLVTQPSTITNVSLQEILNIVRDMFNVYWHIDANYRLRLEHYSWYSGTAIADLTLGDYVFYNEKKIAFSFNKEETPRQEIFNFANAGYIDFIGAPIQYDNACSNNKSITRDVNVTTDIYYLRNTPTDAITTGGLVFWACEFGDDSVLYEPCLISGTTLQNGHLSWANLQYNYHRYGRPLIEGVMNFTDETFLSAIKRRKQNNQKILNCCLDVPETIGTITTELGVGDAILITENLDNEQIDLELNV